MTVYPVPGATTVMPRGLWILTSARMTQGRANVLLGTTANQVQYLNRLVGKPTIWFPNRFDTNRPVQSLKRAKNLKFWIEVQEVLYYASSENKGADQLRVHRKADWRLCLCLCRLLVFPCDGSFVVKQRLWVQSQASSVLQMTIN